MATNDGIALFLTTLAAAGLLTEKRGGPRFQTPEQRAAVTRMWFEMVGEVSDDDLMYALKSYLRDPAVCQWYPQPGTILAHVPGRKEAELDDADELWGIVLRAVRDIGSYGTPTWPEAQAERIEAGLQACGGFRSVCMQTTDEHVATRAAFRNVVRTMQRRNVIRLEDRAVKQLTDKIQRRIE
jgi:hypothetical protein